MAKQRRQLYAAAEWGVPDWHDEFLRRNSEYREAWIRDIKPFIDPDMIWTR
jgi:hypothetical protein